MAHRLYLLRHAQSAPDPEIDESDWSLSEYGCKQAEALIPTLRNLPTHTIYSSPYKRAVQTVEPFALSTRLSINIEADLREKKLTNQWLDDHTGAIKKSWTDFDFRFNDGESNTACRQRVVASINKIISSNPNRTILISSHGNAIGLYLNSIDPNFEFADWQNMRWPELYKVIGKEWSKISLNEIPYVSEIPQKLT